MQLNQIIPLLLGVEVGGLEINVEKKKQSNFLIDLIAFSFTINWHPYLTRKELLPLILYHFIFFTFSPISNIYNHFYTWLSYITFHITTFKLSLTWRIESIEHLFKVPSKAQLFEASNIHNVIIWPIM